MNRGKVVTPAITANRSGRTGTVLRIGVSLLLSTLGCTAAAAGGVTRCAAADASPTVLLRRLVTLLSPCGVAYGSLLCGGSEPERTADKMSVLEFGRERVFGTAHPPVPGKNVKTLTECIFIVPSG